MPSLLELLIKGSAPPPPRKKPESPLAKSLLLLSGVSPRTLDDKRAGELWTPEERELFLPPQDIGGSLPDLRAPQPPAKSLTLTEQAALFGKAIQSIPEAGARFGAALRNGIENLKVLGGVVVKGLERLSQWVDEGRKRTTVERFLFEAYRTREELDKGRPEPMLEFMHANLGTRNPSLDHAAALWEVLRTDHGILVEEMLRSGDPAHWLASRVAYRMGDIRRERYRPDAFCGKILTPDEEIKLRGAGVRPKGERELDEKIAEIQDYRRIIEHVAASGQAVSQERAQIVLKCLELGLDEKECRQILGANAWRALKTRVQGEEKKLWEKFEKNYPNPPSNERYLL